MTFTPLEIARFVAKATVDVRASSLTRGGATVRPEAYMSVLVSYYGASKVRIDFRINSSTT